MHGTNLNQGANQARTRREVSGSHRNTRQDQECFNAIIYNVYIAKQMIIHILLDHHLLLS